MSAALRLDVLRAPSPLTRDDLPEICPCNNDPFGNGPCEDCREEIAKARRKRAFALLP